MKILIANPGSTSYKCKLYKTDDFEMLFQATVEKIGDKSGFYSFQFQGNPIQKTEIPIPDYQTAVNLTLESLRSQYPIKSLDAVGFKTVLSKGFSGCVPLTDEVIEGMEAYLSLAPVHNQVYLTAIRVFRTLLPEKPLVGLFETAFHADMPLYASLYGVPYNWYEKYGVRKYGFHGASHRYIAERTKTLLFPEARSWRVISCHLGGSSSVCAIRDGRSVDTSMGMSPQCGLLNAKRVGDLDPFALLYVLEKEGFSIEKMREILIHQGGVAGISGMGGDFREIEAAMDKGHERAKLAFDTFAYTVKRYIGAYLAVLNGVDVIVFTGGLGQHSPRMRATILQDMDHLGIELDRKINDTNPAEGVISSERSRIKVAVIPTQEELIVAREVARYLKNKS